MTLLKSSEVFDHFGSAHQVSERTFFGLLAFFVTYGLAGTALVADYMMGTTFNPGTIVSLILGLAIPIAGIFVSQSDKWFISFIGYNMVLLPFGVILGPALRETDPDLIRNVAGITAMVTVIMGASGVMFPRFYSQIGGALFIALLGLVGVRILQI